MRYLTLLLLASCTGTPTEPDGGPVPWSGQLPRVWQQLEPQRGHIWARSIVHLHSPWSHDACDGNGLPDGKPNEPCLADLRRGLCEVGIDYAFLTDHPDHASWQGYDELMLSRGLDEQRATTNVIPCEGAHTFWLPGIEDELMPVGLDRHVATDPDEAHEIYNRYTPEAVQANIAAGASVFVAHTEHRDAEHLRTLQEAGLAGIEIFNLHAMFAPDIREEAFELSPFGWLEDAHPFIHPDGTGQPDLLFLALLQQQDPSIAVWDDLLTTGRTAGIGGSDAHQNAVPLMMRDGERGDSYRRSMRWFSNYLLVDELTPEAGERALGMGRLWLVFHVLGVPRDLDLHLVADDGTIYEVGSDAPIGDLHVHCPTLDHSSPQGELAPEIEVQVLRDGTAWKTGCGTYEAEAGHTYRVRVDIVPHHLTPFLGDQPEPWLRSFPWAYSNAIRIGGE